MKRQAGRPSKENSSQLGNHYGGKKSSELLAEQVGQSKNQIFRYVRLTELIPELLDMVDEKKGDLDKVVLNSDVLKKYFPKSYTPLKMQETIIKLLDQWQAATGAMKGAAYDRLHRKRIERSQYLGVGTIFR